MADEVATIGKAKSEVSSQKSASLARTETSQHIPHPPPKHSLLTAQSPLRPNLSQVVEAMRGTSVDQVIRETRYKMMDYLHHTESKLKEKLDRDEKNKEKEKKKEKETKEEEEKEKPKEKGKEKEKEKEKKEEETKEQEESRKKEEEEANVKIKEAKEREKKALHPLSSTSSSSSSSAQALPPSVPSVPEPIKKSLGGVKQVPLTPEDLERLGREEAERIRQDRIRKGLEVPEIPRAPAPLIPIEEEQGNIQFEIKNKYPNDIVRYFHHRDVLPREEQFVRQYQVYNDFRRFEKYYLDVYI